MHGLRTIGRSLRWKFMLLVLLLIAVLVSSIGYFSYYESSRTIKRDVTLFSDQILKQANLHLNQYFLDFEYGFLVLGASYEFEQWLFTGNGDPYDRFIMENRMESKFVVPYTSQYPELLSISIYNDDGTEKIFHNGSNTTATNYTVAGEAWFPEIRMTKGIQIFVRETDIYDRLPESTVITMVKRFEHRGSSGLVKIDISPDRALQILEQIHLGGEGSAWISDKDGQPLLPPGSFPESGDQTVRAIVADRSFGSVYDKASDKMIVFQSLPYTGWKTVVSVPYASVAEGVFRVRDVTIVIALIHIVAGGIIVWMISSSLTSRLRKLKEWIKGTQWSNLDRRFGVEGTDEAAELGSAFNRMLDKLEGSMNELAESQTMQQHATLSALQSQINSHFIYNALESINAMANLIEHRPIMNTTVALSSMLRYTSSYQNETVELREELDHVRDYIRIMNIVYGDRITLELELEAGIESFMCLKAILQPIVENSVRHGIETTGAPMTITVSAMTRRDRWIAVTVHDNGPGIPPAKLQELQEQLTESGRIQNYRTSGRVGLLNVQYRLLVYYKDGDSGIRVSNHQENGGALIRILFPKLPNGNRRKEVAPC